MTVKKGIDVSYAQGNINFEKINKNQVQFAVVRSSFGWHAGQKDNQFDRNMHGFASKGIPCGIYHYSYAESKEDAEKEAEYCLSCIKGTKPQLPVFIDMEEQRIAQYGKRVCTDIVIAFCERIKKAGYQAGVYTNPNWLRNYLYPDEIIGKYNLWLAQWDSAKPMYECMMWQYTVGKKGCIDGISGECDLDIMYVNENNKHSDKTRTDKKKTDTQNKSNKSEKFRSGDKVEVIKPYIYGTTKKFAVYPDEDYTVIEAVGDRVVIGINGHVTAAIAAENLKKAASETGNSDDTKILIYEIRPGDTLTGIAAKYKTSVAKLVSDNNIKNPDLIFSGKKLRIVI